jgi:biofilm PGA synthesis lipoprotein PgaB
MSRGNGKNSSSMNTIWIVLGLAALGTGMGAAIASRLVSNRPSSGDSVAYESTLNSANPTATVTNGSQSFCQYNALDSVTASLYQVRSINAIANDPLPTLSSLSGAVNADLIASFTPAPFPQISDRARAAKIPIIMYHDITAVKDVDWDG